MLNGKIMSANKEVATVKNGIIVALNKELAPLMLNKNQSVEKWLESRAVDSTRKNARLLKTILGLKDKSDLQTVLHFNAATITDNFWFKKDDENLTWDEVQFKDNKFDKVALIGDPTAFLIPYSRTPELTNIGSFDKCWRKEKGSWYLYKKENEEESFCEVLISEIGSEIFNFAMAQYKITSSGVKDKDFTDSNEYNFEPLFSLVGENDDYKMCFDSLLAIDDEIAKDYNQHLNRKPTNLLVG
jgi:hypothetical protein